jgi:aminoglycoside phosphotransferase (APT) family kinase protein
MTFVDEIGEDKAEAEWVAWKNKVIGSTDEIAEFVARRRKGGNAVRIVRYYRGSFNICIRIEFEDDGPDAIIRFPKAGVTAFRDEKVEKEVQVMKFLRQKTTIPVPRLIDWGLTACSPRNLGPFIIMDYVEGTYLSDILKKSTLSNQEKEMLNPEIDNETLHTVYRQIADFMLQLYEIDFDYIGAISEDFEGANTWSVTGRPLTYNMNELATCTGYPADQFPTERFPSANECFRSLANQHLVHLQVQRNLAIDPDDARRRYIARHLFAKLAAKNYVKDNGSFKIFCDDLRPANILVDKETLQITALLDLEFSNAMPAQFAHNPPWWLLLVGPDMWLERGYTMDDFVLLYNPRLQQFLQAMEEMEDETNRGRTLSTLMHDSWRGDFWFNFAARKSLDVDAIFYSQLEKSNMESLDDETQAKWSHLCKLR